MTTPQHTSHWPSWPLPVLPADVQTTARHACSYLPDRWATFRAFDADSIPGDLYQRLLDAGFRRSGNIIYQPMCTGCRDCVPLRVPTGTFQPSKSQRRVLRKNADLVVSAHAPEATTEKWELYDRYQRQWHHHQVSEPDQEVLEFITFLYRSPVPALEFEYRDPWGALLGVGLCDLCPESLSSVYFYFDPAHAARSLGTFSGLYEIQWARDQQLRHWYAGYWIQHCPSMSYKSRFRPCETLSTDGLWRPLSR